MKPVGDGGDGTRVQKRDPSEEDKDEAETKTIPTTTRVAEERSHGLEDRVRRGRQWSIGASSPWNGTWLRAWPDAEM